MALLSASITPTNLVTTSGAATLTNKTFSDNPTFSGGTANGVSFLNGSKVLTSGSALTFDGTVLNLTGTSGEFRSTITGGASSTRLGPDGIYGANTNVYLYAPLTKSLVFYANDVEAAKITSSGNLGVGLTSPSTRLHVKSADNTTASVIVENLNNTNAILQFGSASTDYQILGGAYQGNLRLNAPTSATIDFSINGATKVSVNASGNLSIANGNLVIGTAGKGIDFSADPSAAGMTSELLDDYEEGTWTPSVGGTATYTIQQASYTKVGRLVLVTFDMKILVIGTGSTSAMSGLPFTVGSSTSPKQENGFGASGYIETLAVNVYALSFYAESNNTNIYAISMNTLGGTANVNPAIYGNGTRVQGTVTYMASA